MHTASYASLIEHTHSVSYELLCTRVQSAHALCICAECHIFAVWFKLHQHGRRYRQIRQCDINCETVIDLFERPRSLLFLDSGRVLEGQRVLCNHDGCAKETEDQYVAYRRHLNSHAEHAFENRQDTSYTRRMCFRIFTKERQDEHANVTSRTVEHITRALMALIRMDT